MKIFLNDGLVDEQDAKVSVFDHGLLYGDGVFEGIRAYNGRIFKLTEHINRLYHSAQAIDLKIPITKEEFMAATIKTCAANNVRNGYIRPIVTRGVGNLGLNPFQCNTPGIIIIAHSIQLYPEDLYEKGLGLLTVGTLRNLPEAVNPRIKSLNYLNNILAKIESINNGALECVMLNSQGYVAEASGDNIFVVRGRDLITPPGWCGALEGITRGTVMDLAREEGMNVREDVLSRYDLYTADEVFLTGTAAEIISAVKVDHRVIGTGRPGVQTKKLEAKYRALAMSTGTEIFP